MMRPAVVWFGEALPRREWEFATQAAGAAELFLVIGTSALVQPAASLPMIAKQSGARLIEVNPEPTSITRFADLAIQGKAAEIFGALGGASASEDRVRSELHRV